MTSERSFQRWLRWGQPGHEREYCLIFEEFDDRNFIPITFSLELEEKLPGWSVENRGTRIEICHRSDFGRRQDEEVVGAVRTVVGEVVFNG